jgi:hypothetical protein
MSYYTVIWEIDIEDKSSKGAAKQALEIMRDSSSVATVFQVVNQDGSTTIVDLEEGA